MEKGQNKCKNKYQNSIWMCHLKATFDNKKPRLQIKEYFTTRQFLALID